MTERDEMYQAFVRDRRRLIVVFVLVLAVIAWTLGTGWAGDQSIVVVDWEGVEGVRQAFANGTLPDYAANATR